MIEKLGGLLIGTFGTGAFGVLFGALGLGYDRQHVQDWNRTTSMIHRHQMLTTYTPHAFTHSSASIAAIAAVLGIAWAVLSTSAIAAGVGLYREGARLQARGY